MIMRYIPRYHVGLSPLFAEPPKLTTVELLTSVYELLDKIGSRKQNSPRIAAEEDSANGKYVFHVRSQDDPAVGVCRQDLHVRFNNARRGSWSGAMETRLCPDCAALAQEVFDHEAQLIDEPGVAGIGDAYVQRLLQQEQTPAIAPEQLLADWRELLWSQAAANTGYDLASEKFAKLNRDWTSGQVYGEETRLALDRWLLSLLDEIRSGKHCAPTDPRGQIIAQMSTVQALARAYQAYSP